MMRGILSFFLLALVTACAVQPTDRLVLIRQDYNAVEGWDSDATGQALAAFQKSCGKLLTRNAEKIIGKGLLAAPAADWHAPCEEAIGIKLSGDNIARQFFERYFTPFAASNNGKERGLFTGYYEPVLNGSRKKQGRYTTPIYRLPSDMRDDEPYYTRAQINKGALRNRGLELAWVDDPVQLFFMEIQGSGRVNLDDGRELKLSYGGKNNQPYIAIGKTMEEAGLLQPGEVNFFSIRKWLYDHPSQARAVMEENPSYVFFKTYEGAGPVGAQNVPLTPQRSLAVDYRFIPYGTPIFVHASLPQTMATQQQPLHRLFIAQDTGGAIRGPVRADVFFGIGKQAEQYAGYMKQRGTYTLLVPNAIAARLE